MSQEHNRFVLELKQSHFLSSAGRELVYTSIDMLTIVKYIPHIYIYNTFLFI